MIRGRDFNPFDSSLHTNFWGNAGDYVSFLVKVLASSEISLIDLLVSSMQAMVWSQNSLFFKYYDIMPLFHLFMSKNILEANSVKHLQWSITKRIRKTHLKTSFFRFWYI